MLLLMLDPILKNTCSVHSFIGHEQDVTIVKEYDKRFLFPMFLKFHHRSHPMEKYKSGFANQKDYEDCSLHVF
jgi:hypothetical protein